MRIAVIIVTVLLSLCLLSTCFIPCLQACIRKMITGQMREVYTTLQEADAADDDELEETDDTDSDEDDSRHDSCVSYVTRIYSQKSDDIHENVMKCEWFDV